MDGYGGGILTFGRLTINNSTISGNSTRWNASGIANYGRLMINNSTISGNSAVLCGGVINFSGTVTINNSTISRNAGANSAAIFSGWGGLVTLQNSVVANRPVNNCYTLYGGTIISNGYNLSSDDTCSFTGPGDMNNTDPKLGTLGNYGGPTQTIPLLKGSPAIDAGNPNGCTDGNGNLLTTDQRGRPRPDKEDSSGCDMGAVERQKN
jgi:hypothetical protein